jgi:hemolysin D
MSRGNPQDGVLELLAHHRRASGSHWAGRQARSASLLTVDEADFLPPALALQGRPVSPTLRITGAVLILLVTVTLLWAAVGKVDIVANASGKIIPTGRTKVIASVDTAVVRALHVREGQAVNAGDVLLELDARPFKADRDKAGVEERAAELQRARALALAAAVVSHRQPVLAPLPGVSARELHEAQLDLSGRYQEFSAKLLQLDSDVERYTKVLPIAIERERIYERLLQTQDVSRDAWLEKQQDRIDIEGHLAAARDARAALIAQTEREAYDAITDGTKMAASSAQDALRAASHAEWLTLRAPVNGTVQQLTVHTIGGIVPAAQSVMLVVPAQTHVEVEAFLQNKDVGFVAEGQLAQVKIAAFDYTKYGTIPGRVISVSRDALQQAATDDPRGDLPRKDPELFYSVKVALDRSTILVDGRAESLIPGMSVDVEIKTGRRRVIEYVLSPVLRHGHESLHER